MDIIQIFNNNSFPRANIPRFVFLHGTAGGTSAQGIATFFQRAGVSAHYVIGVDGVIVQCNSESDGAWADGIIDGTPMAGLPFRTQSDGVYRDDWWDPNGINPNNEGIAIEHCKAHDDNSDELTPAQKVSSLWLVNDICTRHAIPKHFADASGGITGHFSVAAKSRQRCPGPYPWDDLWSYLKGAQQPMQPTSFQQKAADKRWDIFLSNKPEGPAPKGTGIYTSWLAEYALGKFYGPPQSHEYSTNDWSGNPIIVQEFAYGWCEWINGSANWYRPNGKD